MFFDLGVNGTHIHTLTYTHRRVQQFDYQGMLGMEIKV